MRTLHLIALLLVIITGAQLVVFVGLMYSHHNSDGGVEGSSPGAEGGDRDGDGVDEGMHHSPNNLHVAKSGGGSKGVQSLLTLPSAERLTEVGRHHKNNINDKPSADGDGEALVSSTNRRQSIGLRVVANLAKIRGMVDGLSRPREGPPLLPPLVPDAAMLLRADERYDPSFVAQAAERDRGREAVEGAANVPTSTTATTTEPTRPRRVAIPTTITTTRAPMPSPNRKYKRNSKFAADYADDGAEAEEEEPHRPAHKQRGVERKADDYGIINNKAQGRNYDQQRADQRHAQQPIASPSDLFVPVIGDIFEKQASVIEERLSAMLKSASSGDGSDPLTITRPPSAITALAEAAVVVLGYNRPDYLGQTLDALLAADLSGGLKKYVSIDGDDAATLRVARGAGGGAFEVLQHERPRPSGKDSPPLKGTMYAAAHYKWVLDWLFIERGHSHVIVLEDDLVVSRDFFIMFEALAPLLAIDDSLWCISSWNDNGFQTFELPQEQFFRTSYFPGLGWMLRREVWVDELSANFPLDNWDHWMRVATTSQRRDCIVPWVSRNRNIGASGTTADAEFYQLYIQSIVSMNSGDGGTNNRYATFKPYGDLRYLLGPQYYESFRKRLLDGSNSPKRRAVLSSEMLPLSPTNYQQGRIYAIGYTEGPSFEALAAQLMIRTTPRATYRHTLWLRYNKADIFLVNRRLSPFADASFRIRKQEGLIAVVASDYGVNCRDVCSAFGDGHYQCDAGQFPFINDCKVLARLIPTPCAAHCTQAWGEDVPNVESPLLAKAEGRPYPMCLESEMPPTCDASHQQTKRLCPCVKGGSGGGGGAHGMSALPDAMARSDGVGSNDDDAPLMLHGGASNNWKKRSPFEEDDAFERDGNGDNRMGGGDGGGDTNNSPYSNTLALVPSERAGMACHDVCQSYKGGPNTPYGVKGWQCASYHFGSANQCSALQKYFPCTEGCFQSRGGDLPNYVSNRDNGQYGRCLFTQESMGCDGSHPHTQRLCPCVPE